MDSLVAIVKELLEKNVVVAFMLAYLGGVLTTFTPCVYPMIPVTLAMTLGTDVNDAVDAKDKWKKLANPFWYCLGIAVTYSMLGVFAAATGTFFGKWAGNPWLYLVLGCVFVLLALNSLDLVRLPTLQFHYTANRTSKVSLFFFGALTGAIFSPCTAPMMGLFLVYASTKNAVVGGALLFFFAAGFSSLLLLMAAMSLYVKRRLPRAGAWMLVVKWTITVVCALCGAYFLMRGLGLFFGTTFLLSR